MERILVVCTGNICRSPMAAAMFKKAFPERQIYSAGLSALVGLAADTKAQDVMHAHGYDISGHRAQQLERWMVDLADLVFVMEERQRLAIVSGNPTARGKVNRLSKWGESDIHDPYRKPQSEFVLCYERLNELVNYWAEKIGGNSNLD